MRAMRMIAFSVPLSALLLMVVAVPLTLQKVPPNPLYGFRTPKTMSNPGVWYRANYRAGVTMVWAGVATLALWAGLALTLGLARSLNPGMGCFCTAVLTALVVSLTQLRRM